MDLHDTVQVDSLEVPVGEHIKEFVVRSGFYIDAIGFKTNKGKTLGLIGGNGGSLKNQTIGFSSGRASDHYYVDGIQGLTVVTQDAPCICEIQFKYVIVPSSDLCPFRAIGKSQNSDSDDLLSNERMLRNLDFLDDVAFFGYGFAFSMTGMIVIHPHGYVNFHGVADAERALDTLN